MALSATDAHARDHFTFKYQNVKVATLQLLRPWSKKNRICKNRKNIIQIIHFKNKN